MSSSSRSINVGPLERVLSLAGGVLAGSVALRWRGPARLAAASAAALLTYRGLTGRSRLYRTLGITGSEVGTTVAACSQISVVRPVSEVYAFLRELTNLARFSRLLDRVEPLADDTWRCSAAGPLGTQMSWDVRMTADEVNRRLAWCALESSPLPGALEIRLNESPAGTEIHVDAWFVPPASPLLSPVLHRMEESRPLTRAGLTPSQMLQQELRRLRQLLEAGEIATIQGQSSGRARRGTGRNRPGEAAQANSASGRGRAGRLPDEEQGPVS